MTGPLGIFFASPRHPLASLFGAVSHSPPPRICVSQFVPRLCLADFGVVSLSVFSPLVSASFGLVARSCPRSSLSQLKSLARSSAFLLGDHPSVRCSGHLIVQYKSSQVKLLNNTQHITLLEPNALDSTHTLPHPHAPSLNPVLSVRRFLLLCA